MSKQADTPQADASAKKQTGKLSFKEKFSVGTGGFTVGLGNQSVRTTGQGVLQMMLGINAILVGIVLAIPLLWDAITDPIMGNISDNFKSKYGRRRPFIFLGAILMGLSFASIWLIPMGWSDAGKLGWFLVTSLLFYTSYTIFSVPFIALTYEMTPDYDERTSVQGYVTFWNRLSEMTYMGIIPLSLTFIAWKYGYADTTDLISLEKMEGIRISAAIYGGLGMTLLGMLPAFFSKERLYEVNLKEHHGQKDPFWHSAKTTLQNKAFAILCALIVFTIIAGIFASNMDWYLLIFYLSEGDMALGTQWKLIVTVGYAVVGILGIPFIVWITGKMTKIHGLMFIYGMMILNATVRWFVYQPGRFDGALAWTSLAKIGASLALIGKSLIWLDPLTGGMFWIGVGVLGQSMVADVCDDDELKNGHRREGMFGAIYGWAMKFSFALSFVLIGFFLEGIGFDPQWGSTRWMSVNASAPKTEYVACKADFAIADDESAIETAADAPAAQETPVIPDNTLSLKVVDSQITETDGSSKVVLSRTGSTGDLNVLLKSTPKSIVDIPSSIVIPDGKSNVEFVVNAIDDGKNRGVQSATLTAWLKGGSPIRSTISVIDNDGQALAIALNGYEISEKDGELTATLTRYNKGTVDTIGDVEVKLEGFCSAIKEKEDLDATVNIPEMVTIPAGEESVMFKIAAIDNDSATGQQTGKTFFKMRVAMCVGAAGPALLCFLLLSIYPLDKQKAEENRRKLEELRAKV